MHCVDDRWGNSNDPVTKQLWSQAKDHRGFIVCGFPATFENPTAEAATPAPIGVENFIRDFLEVRKEMLIDTLKKCVEAATMATATLPVIQAYNCILRTCISQKVGYLTRVTPSEDT